MKKYTLLTGATGFIGQYMLERLLLRDIPVVTIARGKESLSAKERRQESVADLEKRVGRT